MKTNILLVLLLLAPLHALATERADDKKKTDSPAPVPVVTLFGILECRIAIGGETTGWVLRYGDKQRIDLLLPIEAFGWISEGLAVGVKGVFSTKRYPERGDVPVFIVHEIHQVQT
jgi:hypothetical protein